MPRSTEAPSCERVLEHLEAYLDALDGADGAEEGLTAAPPEDRAAVAAHLEHCPACAAELALARRIRAELRALPEPAMPPRVELPAASARRPLRLPVSSPSPLLPRLAAAAALAALLAALVLVLPRLRPPQAPSPAAPYTAAQVEQAEREARYALARLARVTERAGLELRQEVLARRVVAPTVTAVTQSLSPRVAAPPEPRPER